MGIVTSRHYIGSFHISVRLWVFSSPIFGIRILYCLLGNIVYNSLLLKRMISDDEQLKMVRMEIGMESPLFFAAPPLCRVDSCRHHSGGDGTSVRPASIGTSPQREDLGEMEKTVGRRKFHCQGRTGRIRQSSPRNSLNRSGCVQAFSPQKR